MKMRRYWLMLAVSAVVVLAGSVHAEYYLAGSFNGWTSNGTLMADNGDGTYTATVTGLTPNTRHEFKVTQGTWDWSYPGANSWFLTGDNDQEVTVTFNTNTVSDGWLPAANRLALSTDPGTWTIAGSFQGWSNANPATAMTDLGEGYYVLNRVMSPGTYKCKAVVTGSWDSISSDGRSVGTADYEFTVAPGGEIVNFYVDALGGTIQLGGWLEPSMARAHDPQPAPETADVTVSSLELSWAVATDPNGVMDPNLVSHKVYLFENSWSDDPNAFVPVAGWDPVTKRASYVPMPELKKDARYFWRVDMVMDDGRQLKGPIWVFDTELARPIITSQPQYQVLDIGGTAVFTVEAFSETPTLFQWYKDNGDGQADPLLDTALTDETTDTLTIPNVLQDSEGGYFCVIDNDSDLSAVSEIALLGIKRRLAYWPFEGGSFQSTEGGPTTYAYNDPDFVAGFIGSGMAFDNEDGLEDILYTDPYEASFFDICNHSMTVACWVKSGFAAQWGPMVARNGEENGWQLRHSGATLDHACFTTRGTAYDDGTPSDRAVYDDQWHHVVATFDGVEKKLYIDGVVSRVYNIYDGTFERDADPVSGRIAPSPSPVAIGGRVSGSGDSLVWQGGSVSPAILDEVEIYNYALDAETIAQAYATLSGQPVCAGLLLYDLDGNCAVSLSDLALVASEWLKDVYVQP